MPGHIYKVMYRSCLWINFKKGFFNFCVNFFNLLSFRCFILSSFYFYFFSLSFFSLRFLCCCFCFIFWNCILNLRLIYFNLSEMSFRIYLIECMPGARLPPRWSWRAPIFASPIFGVFPQSPLSGKDISSAIQGGPKTLWRACGRFPESFAIRIQGSRKR